MSLRRKLAEFGFESNDDYEFPLRCLFEASTRNIRCLNISGQTGRRKTALAHALGHALDFPHVLYHDFSERQREAPPTVVRVDESGEEIGSEPALPAFDRIVTEACAYSEGARTILTLDQLQTADFREHMRLYQFVTTREWTTREGSAVGNPRNLLLVLISEEPLYHSLQSASFRIWADRARGALEFRPQDFSLGREFEPVFDALATVFAAIEISPTHSEFTHVVYDLQRGVYTVDQLRTILFGWIEGIERERLFSRDAEPLLAAAVHAITELHGLDHIELG